MLIFLSFRNLFRNPRRTLAVLLTVAMGAGALFAFQAFIHGMLEDYKYSTIRAQYGHGQLHAKGYRENVYAEPWKHWIEDPERVEKYLQQQKEVEFIFPRITFSALLKKDNITLSGTGQGVKAIEENKFFHSLNMINGIPLTTQERGIFLGYGLAKALNVAPGDQVDLVVNTVKGTIRKRSYQVTGVFQTGLQELDNHIFRIQLDQAQNLLDTRKVELISIGLTHDDDWLSLAQKVQKEFPGIEATPFNVLDKVYYQHSVDWLNAQFLVVQIIIIAIVLLGIFNTISTSILERKQEIGNLRANGESALDILKLILSEGALLGVAGSLVGILVAYLGIIGFLDRAIVMPPGPGLTRDVFIIFDFNWTMFLTTLGLSVLSAMTASLFAGWKVARMPIAAALRSY